MGPLRAVLLFQLPFSYHTDLEIFAGDFIDDSKILYSEAANRVIVLIQQMEIVSNHDFKAIVYDKFLKMTAFKREN
jgi:hypothetical protein